VGGLLEVTARLFKGTAREEERTDLVHIFTEGAWGSQDIRGRIEKEKRPNGSGPRKRSFERVST